MPRICCRAPSATYANFTFIQTAAAPAAIRQRGGADMRFVNGVVRTPTGVACVNIVAGEGSGADRSTIRPADAALPGVRAADVQLDLLRLQRPLSHASDGMLRRLLLTSVLVAPSALAPDGAAAPRRPRPSTPPDRLRPRRADRDVAGRSAATTDGAERRRRSRSRRPAPTRTLADIVVVGRNIPNTIRATPQVLSVLSTADIARTGEGDIAGALTRVTGLSVVGGGFVYVRGLGDRYSSSLLNGSPLPSPEPLRRSVPLDIFPTSDRRFGARPEDLFGELSRRVRRRRHQPDDQGDSRRKFRLDRRQHLGRRHRRPAKLGYTYDGGDADWIGFDDGTRDVPAFVAFARPNGTGLIPAAQVAPADQCADDAAPAQQPIARQLVGRAQRRLGRTTSAPPGSASSRRLAPATPSAPAPRRSRTPSSADGTLRNDFRTVLTDNRIVANALIGLGSEFDENTIR